MKITNYNFGRKIKSSGYIYDTWSKYRDSEGHLKLVLCLQDYVIISAPRIGKYINKLDFYNKCLPRRLKDKKLLR